MHTGNIPFRLSRSRINPQDNDAPVAYQVALQLGARQIIERVLLARRNDVKAVAMARARHDAMHAPARIVAMRREA